MKIVENGTDVQSYGSSPSIQTKNSNTVKYIRASLYENVEVLTLYSKLKSGIINAPLYKLQYFCHVLHYERKNFAHILDILDILSISKM